MWLLFNHPFGFTFLSKPLLSWGSRAETQLLAASSLSFLINCVYQKVQSGMLGTREPVTPCFVAQNLWGFLSWRLPPVVLGNKQSPIVSSEKLQASEEIKQKKIFLTKLNRFYYMYLRLFFSILKFRKFFIQNNM